MAEPIETQLVTIAGKLTDVAQGLADTQDRIDRLDQTERLIDAIDRLAVITEKLTESIERPSPAWRRLFDEFRGAIGRIPSSIRLRG